MIPTEVTFETDPEAFVRDHVMLLSAFGIQLTEDDIDALRRLGARKGSMADLERFRRYGLEFDIDAPGALLSG